MRYPVAPRCSGEDGNAVRCATTSCITCASPPARTRSSNNAPACAGIARTVSDNLHLTTKPYTPTGRSLRPSHHVRSSRRADHGVRTVACFRSPHPRPHRPLVRLERVFHHGFSAERDLYVDSFKSSSRPRLHNPHFILRICFQRTSNPSCRSHGHPARKSRVVFLRDSVPGRHAGIVDIGPFQLIPVHTQKENRS